MKKKLNSTRIVVKIRCAYALQCASTWNTSSEEYFGLMTEALYEFACASMQIQKAVLKDRVCRAAVAAWIEHTEPCSSSAMQNNADEEEQIDAEDRDRSISAFFKKKQNFTAENVLKVLYWTWNNCIDWTDQTETQTPGHREIGIFLGKHYGTRRRHVSGERKLRGAH